MKSEDHPEADARMDARASRSADRATLARPYSFVAEEDIGDDVLLDAFADHLAAKLARRSGRKVIEVRHAYVNRWIARLKQSYIDWWLYMTLDRIVDRVRLNDRQLSAKTIIAECVDALIEKRPLDSSVFAGLAPLGTSRGRTREAVTRGFRRSLVDVTVPLAGAQG